MASITAAVLCLMRLQAPAPEVSVRDAQLVGVGFSFAVASTIAIMAAQGVSPMQLWESLVLFPNRFFMQTRGFFVPPPLSMLEAEWALVGLLAAAFFAWRRPNPGSMTW